jgi:hypothetical protein
VLKKSPKSLSSEYATEVGVHVPGAPATKQASAFKDSEASPSALAHPPKRLLVRLNDDWRVTEDSSQRILQKRKGNARSKNAGWKCHSFCRVRAVLLRRVRERCGPVSQEALSILETLPEHYDDAR